MIICRAMRRYSRLTRDIIVRIDDKRLMNGTEHLGVEFRAFSSRLQNILIKTAV